MKKWKKGIPEFYATNITLIPELSMHDTNSNESIRGFDGRREMWAFRTSLTLIRVHMHQENSNQDRNHLPTKVRNNLQSESDWLNCLLK